MKRQEGPSKAFSCVCVCVCVCGEGRGGAVGGAAFLMCDSASSPLHCYMLNGALFLFHN